MVSLRRGASKVGCLLTLLVVAALGYFAVNVGEVYIKYFEYKDKMEQEARFAAHRSDAVIRRRIIAYADSLGLPEGARNVIVRRGDHIIFIFAEYYEHIELPGYVRELHFNPSATGTF
jgi:hypothetical protein